jgi:peptidoglycan hydrolase CwlO-like protein
MKKWSPGNMPKGGAQVWNFQNDSGNLKKDIEELKSELTELKKMIKELVDKK